jgi:hypothetical protein
MITVVLLWQVFRSGLHGMRVKGDCAFVRWFCPGAHTIVELVDPAPLILQEPMFQSRSVGEYSFGMLTTIGYEGIAHRLGAFFAPRKP